MPGIITHYLFAKDCLNTIDNDRFINAINNNMEVFLLGCQGPNFFSYYNYLPFLKNKNLSILSTKIHTENINDFFKNMIFYCNDISCIKYIFSNDNFEEVTLAYLLGYISHYTLDTFTHPYIYAQQFKLRGQYRNKNFNSLHKSIETHIDKLLLKKLQNLDPKEFNYYTKTKISSKDLIIISDLYTFLLKKVYNSTLSYNDVSKCIKMFKKTERRLSNSNNLYSSMYLKVKNITSQSSYLDNNIYSKYKHCMNDLLNTDNSDWIDPFTNIKCSKSFYEIYNDSLLFYSDIIINLNLYLLGNKPISEFLDIINDKSYLTNQNWKTNYKILNLRNDYYEI